MFTNDPPNESDDAGAGRDTSPDDPADITVDDGRAAPDDADVAAPDRTGEAPDFSLASRRIQQGFDLLAQGKLVDGRAALSAVLTSGDLAVSPREASLVRERLGKVNERLIFSPVVVPGDPITDTHNVQSGEFLSTIAKKYKIGWEILSRINAVAPERLRAGQDIKVLNGPFHGVVYKSDFRLDLYWKDPSGRPIYIRSFPVGLGAENSTPVGMWKVSLKERNPTWYDPRAGRVLDRDDPENPLGERWIALTGMDENTRAQQGYGIHGTIEPDTIGQQASLGCIRMYNEDVELLFDLLYVGQSRVEVRP